MEFNSGFKGLRCALLLRTKLCMYFSSIHAYQLSRLSDTVHVSSEWCVESSTHYEAANNSIFSILISLHTSCLQYFPQHPFLYNLNISTDVRQPKHHTNTKLQTNTSVYVLTFNCLDWWWKLHIFLKCQYISIIIHGVTSQMTIIC